MDQRNWNAMIAYMSAVWGRQFSDVQRAAGWTLMKSLPNEAVEGAVTAIVESGRETIPPWSVVYKTAQQIAESIRERLPALPQGDTLSDSEHRGAMIRLRAGNASESLRRVARCEEIKRLPDSRWMVVLRQVRAGEIGALRDPEAWDRAFDEIIASEFALVPPPAGQDIHA